MVLCVRNLPDAALLREVRNIAALAGEATLQIYRDGYTVDSKADGTPVTEADRTADELIRNRLTDLAPDVSIISEESVAPGFQTRSAWRRLWLVDPLDGTREFVRGTGEFTVNIALIDNHRPVLGVVLAPSRGICWYAAVGLGAWRCEQGQAVRAIHSRRFPGSGAAVACSKSRGNETMNAFISRLPDAAVYRVGSSIKSCLVAEGAADVYPCFSVTSEWDTAAAQCVLEQAGGGLLDLHMSPLGYNCRESLDNPPFLAVGDIGHDWRALLVT